MSWHYELIEQIARHPCCGYGRTDQRATEPSALAALALAGAGRIDRAERVACELLDQQDQDGSVGVRPGEREPCWTTSLAVLTWLAVTQQTCRNLPYTNAIQRGVEWILADRGITFPPESGPGHDPSLAAWAWVDGTHPWIEPSAFHVLALKAAGYGDHLRTREAVRMLIDRQLPRGGCNYGNTYVLGRPQRPHLQPSGLALLALVGESEGSARIRQSLTLVQNSISEQTTTASLCWSLLGLAAHGVKPAQADVWLQTALRRTLQRDQSPHKLALIALAAQGDQALLAKLPRRHGRLTPGTAQRQPHLEAVAQLISPLDSNTR